MAASGPLAASGRNQNGATNNATRLDTSGLGMIGRRGLQHTEGHLNRFLVYLLVIPLQGSLSVVRWRDLNVIR